MPDAPKLSMSARIKAQLLEKLAATHVDVIDEAPLRGDGSWRVVVVSAAFAGKTPVARHRLVYDALKEEMASLHALAITAKTPDESAHGSSH